MAGHSQHFVDIVADVAREALVVEDDDCIPVANTDHDSKRERQCEDFLLEIAAPPRAHVECPHALASIVPSWVTKS